VVVAAAECLLLQGLCEAQGGVRNWLCRVQPWCRFCGWRWRMWWIEYDYQCEKHWSPDPVSKPGAP